MGKISFLVAEVSGFFCSFFFPGMRHPLVKLFFKGRVAQVVNCFSKINEENEGLKKFHQFGVWKIFDSTSKKKSGSFFGEVYHTQGSNPYRHVEVLKWFFDQWATWLEKNGR